MSPLLFIGSSILLLWGWKKYSQGLHVTFTNTELLLVGCGLIVLGMTPLFSAKLVVSSMYEALVTSHMISCRFLGNVLNDPGPFFYPVMWFVWSGLLTLPLIAFTMYRIYQMRLKDPKVFRIAVVMFLII